MGTDEFCSGQEAAGNPSHVPRRAAAVEPDARYRELFGAAAEIVDGIERIKELIAAEGETITLKDGRLNMHPGICEIWLQHAALVKALSCRRCGNGRGKKRIHDLEHHRRLSTPPVTNATAPEPEAARWCWVATGCERLEPQLCGYAGGFVYGRDKLGMTLSEKEVTKGGVRLGR